MTNISYYPRTAWRPGNEALHVTTSASPAMALSHSSALGMALYGATDTLHIDTYPAEAGVVFEGSTTQIDKYRERLVRIAPEIALRALNECESGRDVAGGISHLSGLVGRFGAPLAENDSFEGRIKSSVGSFAQETTWDGCFEHSYTRPYKMPLDHRIEEILRRLQWPQGAEGEMSEQTLAIPIDTVKTFEALAGLDNVSAQQEILTALQYYQELRLGDPDLSMKVSVHNSLKRQARPRWAVYPPSEG